MSASSEPLRHVSTIQHAGTQEDTHVLPEWQVLPLDFEIVLRHGGRFPGFKGVLLRGAFGVQFRRTVCSTKQRDCEGCGLLETCAFPYVFDSATSDHREATGSASILRSLRSHAPHPFCIRAPEDSRTEVPEGTVWRFRFVLIGNARQLLPYFIHAFVRLEKSGLGQERIPFDLRSVRADLPSGAWEVYAKGASALRYPPESRGWPTGSDAERLKVTFRTLTRVKTGGRITREMPFSALARAALRRVSALHALYCGDLQERDNRTLLKAAEDIRIVESDLRGAAIDRFSTRTRQRIVFDGVVGPITYEGRLAAWLPYLQAASAVNIGKGSTFGFGVMELQEE